MSNAIAITTETFESEVLKSSVPVIVDFWAVWCGPCQIIAPHLDALANEQHGKVKVVKVDIDQERDIAEKYNVMSIPTLMFFVNGAVVDQIVGAVPKRIIEARLADIGVKAEA